MRVTLVALALITTPFVASLSQDRTKSKEAPASAQQKGQHEDEEKCAVSEGGSKQGENKGEANKEKKGEKRKSSGARGEQQGQHEDDQPCKSTQPPPPPPPAGLAQIRGMVFSDVNGNGKPDLGEPGLVGVTLLLTGAASATATTDATGAYIFTGLPIGTYKLCAQAPAGVSITVPVSGPACATGAGWTLDVPPNLPDLWYVGINFATI